MDALHYNGVARETCLSAPLVEQMHPNSVGSPFALGGCYDFALLSRLNIQLRGLHSEGRGYVMLEETWVTSGKHS